MPRPRPAQLGLAAAALLVSLAVLDRVLVAWLPLGAIVYEPDPDALYRYAAGRQKLFIHTAANGGEWVRVRINRDGFRGPELRPRGEAARVVVYGDSFVAAEFSPWEESFVARLGAGLEARLGRPVEAVNAGLVGAGPDQVARRLPREVPSLAPDLVLVAVTAANDFGDLVRNRLYEVGPQGELRARRPRVGPGLARALASSRGPRSGWLELGRAALRGVRMRLAGVPPSTVPFAAELLARATAEHRAAMRERERGRPGEPVVRNLFVDGWDADVALRPDSPSARDKRARMAAILAELDRVLTRLDVPWALVVVPSPIDATPGHYGMRIDPGRYPAYHRRALTDAVATPARARGIPVLDLFDTLSGPDAASYYYTAGNDHWNARGQARAAAAAADWIAAEGWLGKGNRGPDGAGNGTRTRDLRNHNPAL